MNKEVTQNQIEALKNLAKSRGVKLAPNGDYFRKSEAYKAKYKALAALPPAKKAWSDKAVAALKAYAQRVGFPGADEITAENAREMQKQVKAYAEAHRLLSEHGRAVWERKQQKAA